LGSKWLGSMDCAKFVTVRYIDNMGYNSGCFTIRNHFKNSLSLSLLRGPRGTSMDQRARCSTVVVVGLFLEGKFEIC